MWKSTLLQVMVWCHQATSRNLNWIWPDLCHHMWHVTRPQWVNPWCVGLFVWRNINTVCCRYNTNQFYKKDIYKRHPIVRPLGRGMGCLLWIQPLLDILLLLLQWRMQYLVTLDHAITALDCICNYILCHTSILKWHRWVESLFMEDLLVRIFQLSIPWLLIN